MNYRTIDPQDPYDGLESPIDPILEMLMGRDELAEIAEDEDYQLALDEARRQEEEEYYHWWLLTKEAV